LWEIPEDGVKKNLSNKEFLAACDVAVFAYASSDEKSWKRSKELLLDVARHGLILAKPEFFLGDKEDVREEG
jgi:Ras family protein T1